jgi:hypothetical protein
MDALVTGRDGPIPKCVKNSIAVSDSCVAHAGGNSQAVADWSFKPDRIHPMNPSRQPRTGAAVRLNAKRGCVVPCAHTAGQFFLTNAISRAGLPCRKCRGCCGDPGLPFTSCSIGQPTLLGAWRQERRAGRRHRARAGLSGFLNAILRTCVAYRGKQLSWEAIEARLLSPAQGSGHEW